MRNPDDVWIECTFEKSGSKQTQTLRFDRSLTSKKVQDAMMIRRTRSKKPPNDLIPKLRPKPRRRWFPFESQHQKQVT